MRFCGGVAVTAVLCSIACSIGSAQQQPAPVEVEEASIADIQSALRGGVSCHALVQRYLDRMAAYDKNGPAINAIVIVNPDALAVADSLDRRYRAANRFVGPLHCVPMIVKDNMQ